ncbi:MAG: ROK family protein [Candidatus Promineifilaceae bacterium]|nr:ROK family protein [Candidatus Promineifilaceae bacterium]
MLIGGIEAGGTKFVCAVGSSPGDLGEEVRFPTTTPDETLDRAITFFRQQEAKHGSLAAIGVAAFGPLDPNLSSPTYGFITTTPKPGWANTDVVGTLRAAFNIPIGFDTDVNGAALAEGIWGAAADLHTFVYLTIGTGIGGGALVNGKLLHGLLHPEMGHMRLPHDWQADPYPGRCPYHGDCLEGMASGPAIEQRWGVKGQDLDPDHPAWDLEADYLALALQNLIVVLSPQRIIMGGGVMDVPGLLEKVRAKTVRFLNGYVRHPTIIETIDQTIVPPLLGNQAGVLGAIALARKSL